MDLCTREGTREQAAGAVRALAAIADCQSSLQHSPARTAASAALRETASTRSLALTNSRLATNLAVLAVFAHHFPREFQRHEQKVMPFASARIIASGDDAHAGDKTTSAEERERGGTPGAKASKGKKRSRAAAESGGGESNSPASSETLCASMELLCNCFLVAARREEQTTGGVSTRSSTGGSEEELLKAVFSLLESGGQPTGEAAMSTKERAQLRLAGARCVVRLCLLSGRVRVSPRDRVSGGPSEREGWNELCWRLSMGSVSGLRGCQTCLCRG